MMARMLMPRAKLPREIVKIVDGRPQFTPNAIGSRHGFVTWG